MNKMIMFGGAKVELRFAIVTEAPFRGRHTSTRTFEVRADGTLMDLSIDNGRRIGRGTEVPIFERAVLRRQPKCGDEVCLIQDGSVWGMKRFFDRALAPAEGLAEDPDQRRARQWAEMSPEEISALAGGANRGVSHKAKFTPSRPQRRRY